MVDPLKSHVAGFLGDEEQIRRGHDAWNPSGIIDDRRPTDVAPGQEIAHLGYGHSRPGVGLRLRLRRAARARRARSLRAARPRSRASISPASGASPFRYKGNPQ
jgi:hypothetical protein